MSDKTINELVKDIHNSVQDSSQSLKTTQELIKEIRNAVANGVISEQEVRDLIIGGAPEELDTFKEVSDRLAHSGTTVNKTASSLYIYPDKVATPNINSLVIKGSTKQNTYTGKNILDINNAEFAVLYNNKLYVNGYLNSTTSVSNDYVTFDQKNKNAGMAVCLGKLPAGNYSVANNMYTTNLSICTTNSFPTSDNPIDITNLVSPYTNGSLFTAPGDLNIWMCWYAAGTTKRRFNIISLVKDEEQTINEMAALTGDDGIEPYVGGKPSPNVDYPQNIIGAIGFNNYEMLQEMSPKQILIYSMLPTEYLPEYYYAVIVNDGRDSDEQYEIFGTTEKIPTLYDGDTIDLTTGVLTRWNGVIDSYNGEDVGQDWVSSMDICQDGNTPSIGAKVVYKLPEPIISTVSISKNISVIRPESGIAELISTCAFDIQYQEDENRYRNKFDIAIEPTTALNLQSLFDILELNKNVNTLAPLLTEVQIKKPLPSGLCDVDFIGQIVEFNLLNIKMKSSTLIDYNITESIFAPVSNVISMTMTGGIDNTQQIQFTVTFDYNLEYIFDYNPKNGDVKITQSFPNQFTCSLTHTVDIETGNYEFEGVCNTLPSLKNNDSVLRIKNIDILSTADDSMAITAFPTYVHWHQDGKAVDIQLSNYYGYRPDEITNLVSKIDLTDSNNPVYYLQFTKTR